MPDSAQLNMSNFDICECGDYRKSHERLAGACKGCDACPHFTLEKIAAIAWIPAKPAPIRVRRPRRKK